MSSIREDFRDVLNDLVIYNDETGNLMIAKGFQLNDLVDILVGVVVDHSDPTEF